MGQKLSFVLIDDSSSDNYYHRLVIENTDLADNILDFQYAEQALKYFQESDDSPADIVFVDLHMPRMCGFEFINLFQKLPPSVTQKTKMAILTTSRNPAEKDIAKRFSLVSSFLHKPLREQDILDLMV